MSLDKYTTPLRSPVLFIAFTRYDSARQVMEAIREARPPRLYFACDGPRNEAEKARCERVRSLVELVDWDCQLFTRFSDVNMGVMMGESTAMDWFWEHEEEGIVLEDDTLPAQSFFRYCDELLERYRHDERVWCIMGNNLMTDWPQGDRASYYCSAHGYGAYWGWAGWRRVWKQYDVEMKAWPAARDAGSLDDRFLTKAEKDEAYRLFEAQYDGTIRSWDYQMDFARLMAGGITCIPSSNLIRNIGFGSEGTHTVSENDPRNLDNVEELGFPLVHPADVVVDEARDRVYFDRFIRTSRYRLFKNAVKNILPDPVDKAVTPIFSRIQRKLGLD